MDKTELRRMSDECWDKFRDYANRAKTPEQRHIADLYAMINVLCLVILDE